MVWVLGRHGELSPSDPPPPTPPTLPHLHPHPHPPSACAHYKHTPPPLSGPCRPLQAETPTPTPLKKALCFSPPLTPAGRNVGDARERGGGLRASGAGLCRLRGCAGCGAVPRAGLCCRGGVGAETQGLLGATSFRPHSGLVPASFRPAESARRAWDHRIYMSTSMASMAGHEGHVRGFRRTVLAAQAQAQAQAAGAPTHRPGGPEGRSPRSSAAWPVCHHTASPLPAWPTCGPPATPRSTQPRPSG
jgi:hypothetical protein